MKDKSSELGADNEKGMEVLVRTVGTGGLAQLLEINPT